MQSRKLLRVAARTIIGLLIITLALGPLLSVKDVPTASGETDETTYYLLTDHLGSVDVVLDDQGNVVERRDYLPYGQERVAGEEAGAPETDYGFTGKELDSETNLYYYGARYFDPLIGRFVSRDPVEGDLKNPQSMNKYSYAYNNPIAFIDPTGKWGVSWLTGSPGHQIITETALRMAYADKSWKDTHTDDLVFGASKYADIFVKLRYGQSDPSFHSTTPDDITNAKDLKTRMMGHAERFYKSSKDKEFGRLLHMVQDSYSPSHVKRDKDGNITAFYDYKKQNFLKHAGGDSIKNADLNTLVGAVEATKTLIEYRANPDATWKDVKQYLDKSVLKLSEDATVGTPGKKYKN